MKFLKITFIFLIFLITIELGYIIFLFSRKENQKFEGNQKIEKPLKKVHRSIPVESFKKIKEKKMAFHPSVWENILKRMYLLPDSEAKTLIYQESGIDQIIEVERKEACVEDRRNGVLYPGVICFPFAFRVENKDYPESSMWFYLTEKNLEKVSVFKKNGQDFVRADLEEIKPGVKIKRIELWDPSHPFDINNLKDYLDKQIVDLKIYVY
ncbi:MAG: hypothetical protein NZZ41_07105 [Candidatus Dojkabacteria bacterium]|nr:hypothetical protein [Candidatus Dojkabacteria bacterium]